MRWMNRLATALILLLLLAGPPAGAVLWAAHTGWQWPTAADARAWLDEPLTADTILAGVIITAGLLWLAIVALTVWGITERARLRWRRLRRLPLPTPAQATAGSLAGAALFGVPTLTAPTVEVGPPPATGIPQHHPDHDHTHTLTRQDPQIDTADTRAPADASAGVDLPDGGWIPATTAQQVAATVSLMWLRRRRGYRPGPHSREHRDDADLQPVPAAVATIAAAYPHDNTTTPASSAAGELLALDQFPTTGVGLAGPGAAAAARGLLVTALLTNTAGSAAPVPVVTTRDDLAELLARPPADLPRVPGLHLTDDLDAALHHLRRVRPRLGDSYTSAPRRPLVLLTHGPAASVGRRRLHDVSADNDRVIVTVGADQGTVWHVAVDGTVHSSQGGDEPRRLCVLGAQTAADLLTLIAQARDPVIDGTPPTTPTVERDAAEVAPDREPATAKPDPLPANASTAPAQLTLLGSCDLRIHGAAVTLRRSAALQIVVFLAVHPEGATGRQLIEAIWPGLRPGTITNRLHTTLTHLRKDTEPLGPDDIVYRDNGRYLLNRSSVHVDLWHLQAAIQATAATITTADRNAAHRSVIAGYSGELAPQQPWPWLAGPREALRRAVTDAYAHLARTAAPEESIGLLREAINLDPYNEHLQQQAIQALAAIGDYTAITTLHESYTRRLRTAGLKPTAELTALVAELTPPDTNRVPRPNSEVRSRRT